MKSLRRALIVVALLGLAAWILLLLGHDTLEGYLKRNAPKPPAAEGAGRTLRKGRVTFDDGRPAPGATVEISWTGPEGGVHRDAAIARPDGAYELPADVPQGAPTETRATLGPLSAGTISTSADSGSDLTWRLAGEFVLAGLVQSRADRAPVPGAKVTIGSSSATTGPDGEFRLEGVPASVLRAEGGAVLSVEAPGFAPLRWPIPMNHPHATYSDLMLLLAPR